MTPQTILKARLWLLAGAFVLLSGCAIVDPAPDYTRTAKLVEQATGHGGLYRLEGDAVATKNRVATLLLGGLSLEDAVEVCLLNNASLRAGSLDVGLAHADFVQSGLLSNPSINGLLRFPVDGGKSAVEAGIAQNLIEIWRIPVKKRRAQQALESTALGIAYETASAVAETKTAYYSAIAAQETLEVEKKNVATTKTFFDLVVARQQLGATTQVDVNAAQSEMLEQEVILRETRLSLFEAKRRLAILLGLEIPPNELELTDPLPPLPQWTLGASRLISLAKESRLDLRAANKNVLESQYAITLEKRLFLSNARAGVGLESEDSQVSLGPAFGLTIPVFDQNKAQIAKAEMRLTQANHTLAALTVAVVQQVRGAHEGFLASIDIVRSYQDRILPLSEGSLELAQDAFSAGKTGILSVLVAQRKLLAARREYFWNIEQLALRGAMLETSIGIPFSDWPVE